MRCGWLAAQTTVVAAMAGSAVAQPVAAQSSVTYNRDIAPIVYRHCGNCHRPDGAAPFSLITYAAARQRATQMAVVTERRLMPPWKANAAHGEFVGMTPLAEAEIQAIRRWAEAGAPEGNASDLPPAPRWPEGWQLGQPDLVVRPAVYSLPAAGTDVFRIFAIPLPVDRPVYVRGLEFQPGPGQMVHHATIRIDPTANSRRLDDEDPAAGYDGLISRTAGYPDGHFLGWTPGQTPPLLPKGLSWRLDPGTDLVVELHLQPTGKVETLQPAIGLYFTDDPPDRTPVMLRLGRQSLEIAPGDSRYTLEDSFVLPVDVEVQALQPHAHYRGRQITAAATLPDGTVRRLLEINDWDFRWQHVYRYVKPVALPKGTTLSMRIVYDNSTGNPRNPVPPARVRWGQRSGDEMGDFWVQVLTRNEADRERLAGDIHAKMIKEDVIGYRARIAAEPSDPSLRDDVALLYLEMGQPALAVEEFAAAAKLKPASAPAQYNLGYALTAAGREGEAMERFREALRLNPDYVYARNNLGGLLLKRGLIDEALIHLREAVRLDPSYKPAQENLKIAERLKAGK